MAALVFLGTSLFWSLVTSEAPVVVELKEAIESSGSSETLTPAPEAPVGVKVQNPVKSSDSSETLIAAPRHFCSYQPFNHNLKSQLSQS